MKVANFYPGPSRVYSNITEYICDAYADGIMSINHRSGEFMSLLANTKRVLRKQLAIPVDYDIVFTSSATESWEIIAQSLTSKKSQHFFNGAFGEKWANYAGKIRETAKVQFGINETLPTGDVFDADVYCVTQNETSNATQVSMGSLKVLREELDSKLIAVDVTSSFGGVELNFSLADVWYGSVQKCLGLPAGLGFMILSPLAIQTAEKIGEKDHYNSLLRILENSEKNQTSYTPNVLGIYLLCRTQNASEGIAVIQDRLKERYMTYTKLFQETNGVSFLIDNEEVRSTTVLALKTDLAKQMITTAKDQGIILGNGYGPWKQSTFRIANFPAIKDQEVEKLINFFEKYY